MLPVHELQAYYVWYVSVPNATVLGLLASCEQRWCTNPHNAWIACCYNMTLCLSLVQQGIDRLVSLPNLQRACSEVSQRVSSTT